MEERILEMIQDPVAFSAFINENMKTSTYKIGWNTEMSVEYEPSNNWSAAVADHAAAMMGTVIADNADRVKHDLPSIGEISGALARMGDEWQLPNDVLKRYYYMENRFRDRYTNLTTTQKQEQYKNLVKFLFERYEKAAIAPHRRILAQYLEGLSDGQVTLTKTNNEGGIVWSQPIGVTDNRYVLRPTDVVWNKDNLKEMDILAILQYIEEQADKKGKRVIKHRVSKATAALICQAEQFQKLIGLTPGQWKTETTPGIGLGLINQYISSIGTGYAPFEIVDETGALKGGYTFGMFKDGRICAMCEDRVAVLKVSDSLEMVDPVPGVVYSTYEDNLISQWRDKRGRYVGYEMFAFPAFVGKNDFFVYDVTKKGA